MTVSDAVGSAARCAGASLSDARGGLWCTARTNVEGFYTHYEFKREGDVFEIEGGGPHVLMTWNPPERGRGVPASIKRAPAGADVEEETSDTGEAGEPPDAEAEP